MEDSGGGEAERVGREEEVGLGRQRKGIFRENDILHQDSKVGDKDDCWDNYWPKKYGALRTVQFSVHKSKIIKNHTLPN